MRRPGLAAVTVAVFIAAACGIPPDDKATIAQPGSVPYDLLGDGPAATATTQGAAQTEKATIFLV